MTSLLQGCHGCRIDASKIRQLEELENVGEGDIEACKELAQKTK